MIPDEAVEAARVWRQACERAITAAVARGDLRAADSHTAAYIEAAADEYRLGQELIHGWKPA